MYARNDGYDVSVYLHRFAIVCLFYWVHCVVWFVVSFPTKQSNHLAERERERERERPGCFALIVMLMSVFFVSFSGFHC